MTRICVVGCGAIGSLFAAHLARVDGVEVWGLDVSAPHVAAINANGLTITGRDEFIARIQARTAASEIPPCDLGIVATKSEYTAAAMQSAAAIFANAAVATVQNGVGNEEVVALSAPRVIRATTLIAGAVTAPGVVRYDAPGDTWLGPFEPKPARADEYELLADLLLRGGMGAHARTDARGAQWTKLVFNAATNAAGALTGLTIGQVGSSPSLRSLVSGLIAEGRAVAAAQGIELDADPQYLLDDAVENAFWHRASMLQDVAARRHTEVAVLNGGIAAAGRAAGVPTPLNDLMVELIGGLEESWAAELPH
jgi:2-dehydropantoate 2-reductase